MQIKIVWRNLIPGDVREAEKTKEIEIDDPFETTTADVERDAVLDTPPGYYLSKILFPEITFQYDRHGKKEEKRDIDNYKFTN